MSLLEIEYCIIAFNYILLYILLNTFTIIFLFYASIFSYNIFYYNFFATPNIRGINKSQK